MVRAKLVSTNPTDSEIQLNFRNTGDLTQPIRASSVSVIKFSIPNASTPFMEFQANRYQITLTHNGFEFSQYLVWEDRGTTVNGINKVYEIDHLVSMMNTAFSAAVTGLNILVPLPTVVAPRVLYNTDTSRYEIIVKTTEYNSAAALPIKIYFNRPLFYIFKSVPIIEHPSPPAKIFELLVKPIAENVYLTNFTKILQEAITFSNYAEVRNILITTSMPVEGMIICSTSSNSGQSSLNVIQSYTIPYTNGVIDISENLDFNSPENNFRACRVSSNIDIYSIKCDVYYETSKGEVKQFYLPPFTSANIELEFTDEQK